MEIQILQMLKGAMAAKGIAVVIDVFRAFSVEAYLFAGGAEKVIPVADFEMCTKADIFDFAMELISDGAGLPYMKKIEV